MSKKYFCDKCGKETDRNELYHHAGYNKSYEDLNLNSKIDTFCSAVSAASGCKMPSEPKYYDLCPHCREAMEQWMNIFIKDIPPMKSITGVFIVEDGKLMKPEDIFSQTKSFKIN